MTVTITAKASHTEGRPGRFEASARFDTREAAEAFAATMPKALGAQVATVRVLADGSTYHLAAVYATLLPRKGNAINETGVRRWHGLVRFAERAGVALEWDAYQQISNGFPTREAFEAAIA